MTVHLLEPCRQNDARVVILHPLKYKGGLTFPRGNADQNDR